MQNVFAFILVTSATVGFPAFADDANHANAEPDPAAAREDNRKIQQALPLAAEWLLEHPDPRKRAAGLLYRVSAGQTIDAQAALVEKMTEDDRFQEYDSIRQEAVDALESAEARDDKLRKFEPAELLDRFEEAIRTTTDGAALAWLASACASADIEAFCVDAGLDDAIARHDSANLFSRLTLFPDADAETRDRLIIEAENTRNYVNQLTALWFEALDKGPGAARLKPFDKLGGAAAMDMAYGIPGYQDVTQPCRAEITPGGELHRACGRIAEQMMSDSQTLIGQLVGLSLASSLAEARDDQATVARLEQRKVYQNAVHIAAQLR